LSWLRARIIGVSVWGPGLPGWAASVGALSGATDYMPLPSPAPPPTILSATERRRTGPVARLALAVASEAATMSGLPPGSLRGVFASAGGDGLIVGSILEDLTRSADAARLVSPTQFHNSVHNAAAGYWSIATASQRPVTCVACHDATWAAGLLTALAELVTQGEPVLLCAYDHPLPPPLDVKRPTIAPFGVALVLSPAGTADGLAGVSVRFVPEPAPPEADVPDQPALRPLAAGNAAARSLPLLELLARGAAGSHVLPYLDGRLDVELTP
jgi:hypothetical protein